MKCVYSLLSEIKKIQIANPALVLIIIAQLAVQYWSEKKTFKKYGQILCVFNENDFQCSRTFDDTKIHQFTSVSVDIVVDDCAF